MFDQFGEQALPTPGHLQHPVRRKNVGLLSSRRVELAGKWTYGTGSGVDTVSLPVASAGSQAMC